MVRLHRLGKSIRSIATQFQVDKKTVKKWIDYAGNKRLDRVDFSDKRKSQPKVPHNKLAPEVERCIIQTRQWLRQTSDLGEYGAKAIRQQMKSYGCSCLPSERAINYVLARNGLQNQYRRQRFLPPPAGWYLPEVCSKEQEMDCFDHIEDLRIQGTLEDFSVFNATSLHGSLACSWIDKQVTSNCVAEHIIERFKRFGRPAYAQFDNALVFRGPHKPDCLGLVTRVCLELNINVVFTIPCDTGLQAKIERYNKQWKDSVWNRFCFENLQQLQIQSERFVEAYRQKRQNEIAHAPTRQPVPLDWEPSFPTQVTGKVIYLRRTDDYGQVNILGQVRTVHPTLTQQLVRCEVDLTQGQIVYYRLHRRRVFDNEVITIVPYEFPCRKFKPCKR